MVRVKHDVEANRDEGQGDFKPLPAQAYKARIVGSKLVEYGGSKVGKLEFEFEVDGEAHPEYGGRKFWTSLLLYHETGKAETTKKIARGHLSAICDAAGFVGVLENTEDVHFKPMTVHIKHRTRGDATYAEPYKYEAAAEDWGTMGEGGQSSTNGDFLDVDEVPY